LTEKPSFQYKTSGFHLKSPHQPGDSIRHLFIPYPWGGHVLTFEFGSRFHSPSQKRSRFFFFRIATKQLQFLMIPFDDLTSYTNKFHPSTQVAKLKRKVEKGMTSTPNHASAIE